MLSDYMFQNTIMGFRVTIHAVSLEAAINSMKSLYNSSSKSWTLIGVEYHAECK